MPHFFIESKTISNNNIIINDKNNYKHIAKSLRAKIGEKLLLIDENCIQYETKIINITSSEIECNILNQYLSKRDLEFDLFLAQSPLRSDAQITLIEKATELGIRAVFPIITDNCALNREVISKKIEKWQKTMYESSKQCERAKIPTCMKLCTIESLLKKDFNKIIIFVERNDKLSLKKYLKENPIKKGDKILIIIGPEGGFSNKEFEFFSKNNLPMVSLGNLILRAETAVITALGNIVYEYSR